MNENLLKESLRHALKKVDEVLEQNEEDNSNKKTSFVPSDKEHLSENKKILNEELIRRWIPKSKKVKTGG